MYKCSLTGASGRRSSNKIDNGPPACSGGRKNKMTTLISNKIYLAKASLIELLGILTANDVDWFTRYALACKATPDTYEKLNDLGLDINFWPHDGDCESECLKCKIMAEVTLETINKINDNISRVREERKYD
jgi:hypothetical protein